MSHLALNVIYLEKLPMGLNGTRPVSSTIRLATLAHGPMLYIHTYTCYTATTHTATHPM